MNALINFCQLFQYRVLREPVLRVNNDWFFCLNYDETENIKTLSAPFPETMPFIPTNLNAHRGISPILAGWHEKTDKSRSYEKMQLDAL